MSHLLLLPEVPLGLQSLILLPQASHLIYKGSKLVEALDLLLLLVAHSLDVRVHFQLQGAQQARVHLDSCVAPHTLSPTSAPLPAPAARQGTLVAADPLGKVQGAGAGAGPTGV